MTYIIECEVYKQNILALKFYNKNHSLSEKKFSFLTNTHEIYSIINTCIQVIPILEEEHIGCSFVAIGAQGISPDGRREQIERTQRYLAYKKILFELFKNASSYSLIDSDEHSALLMMNILEFIDDENLNDENFNEKVLNKHVKIIEVMELEFLEMQNFNNRIAMQEADLNNADTPIIRNRKYIFKK